MKLLITILFITSMNLFAAGNVWEIVRSKAESVSDQKIKITVTVKNLTKDDQQVPASFYTGEENMALPNSYIWPQELSMKDAMRVPRSHYYTHNSMCCAKQTTMLKIPANGEVSFTMFDLKESVGKRLLLVFGEGMFFNEEDAQIIIGTFTVPTPLAQEPQK